MDPQNLYHPPQINFQGPSQFAGGVACPPSRGPSLTHRWCPSQENHSFPGFPPCHATVQISPKHPVPGRVYVFGGHSHWVRAAAAVHLGGSEEGIVECGKVLSLARLVLVGG